MTIKVDGFKLYLGRKRRDGRRNVERVRLDLRRLLPSLRKAKIPARMEGDRLSVQLLSDRQPWLPFGEVG